MKQLLPILLCYVLMTSQVFAISGGPVIGGGSLNPVGTYSGVINVNQIRQFPTDPTTGLPAIDPNTGQPLSRLEASPAAVGLFSLGIPSTSVARGAALIFVEGVVYTGTITGSVDPDSGKLSGILNATFQYTVTRTTTTGTASSQVTAQANGKVQAQVSATRQGALSSARLNGTSIIQVADGGLNGLQFIVNRALDCTITGFRQSTTPSTVTTLTTT